MLKVMLKFCDDTQMHSDAQNLYRSRNLFGIFLVFVFSGIFVSISGIFGCIFFSNVF